MVPVAAQLPGTCLLALILLLLLLLGHAAGDNLTAATVEGDSCGIAIELIAFKFMLLPPKQSQSCCSSVPLILPFAAGQGYNPPPSINMGSSNRQQALAKLQAISKAFVSQWGSKGGAVSCNSGKASMCAPASSSTQEQQAALMLATSPSDFSSARLEDTGLVRVIADAEDQQDCNTCTALAVVAAAQAAVATVLQVDVNSVLLSSQVGVGARVCAAWPSRDATTGWMLLPPHACRHATC